MKLTTAERIRECGCPDWVVQCAHVGELMAWVLDTAAPSYPGGAHLNVGFEVAAGTPANGCGGHSCGQHVSIFPNTHLTNYTTLAAALDEFRRREAELLGHAQ